MTAELLDLGAGTVRALAAGRMPAGAAGTLAAIAGLPETPAGRGDAR